MQYTYISSLASEILTRIARLTKLTYILIWYRPNYIISEFPLILVLKFPQYSTWSVDYVILYK